MRRTRLKIAARLAGELFAKDKFDRIAMRVARLIIAVSEFERQIDPYFDDIMALSVGGKVHGIKEIKCGNDECSVDVTFLAKNPEGAQEIAKKLQDFPGIFQFGKNLISSNVKVLSDNAIVWQMKYVQDIGKFPVSAISHTLHKARTQA